MARVQRLPVWPAASVLDLPLWWTERLAAAAEAEAKAQDEVVRRQRR